MKRIDFDGEFRKYLEKWMAANAGGYKNVDEMEQAVPDVYLKWLNTPADFLDGEMPGTYFARFDDPRMLLDWVAEYESAQADVPDQLLERIADLGAQAVPALREIAGDTARSAQMRVTVLNLLKEIDTQEPMADLIAIVRDDEAPEEVRDVAAEALAEIGAPCVEPVLAVFDGSGERGRERFLDILSNYPGDERIFAHTLQAFRTAREKRALYASYLAKLGDERALETLQQALTLTELNYLDYIEIRNAIEALGGEAAVEREFPGDPYYETLRNM